MQRSPYTGSATPPQETVAFCHWLLAGADDTAGGNGSGPAILSTGGMPEGHGRWHRLLRDATEDGFSQLLRAVRREAALLAERSAPRWDEVGRADPLAKAVAH